MSRVDNTSTVSHRNIAAKTWRSWSDIPECRWYTVEADEKRRARINCIAHLLSVVPYQPVSRPIETLPARHPDAGYVRPSQADYAVVPDRAAALT